MSTEIKYDVFISSKSEDYHLAEKVYDFLTDKGLSVFLASKVLEKLGDSEYASKIDEVLDNSLHLIVVSSKLDHINSKWVKYEWSVFSNDLKSGYRQGNLLTILSDSIQFRDLPASLRHQQSFSLDAFQENIMGYLVSEDGERAKRLQQIREQLENLETRKYQIEQEISEQEKALSGLRNEKRIVEDKIENLWIERSHLLGYQHVDEKKKPKPELKDDKQNMFRRLGLWWLTLPIVIILVSFFSAPLGILLPLVVVLVVLLLMMFVRLDSDAKKRTEGKRINTVINKIKANRNAKWAVIISIVVAASIMPILFGNDESEYQEVLFDTTCVAIDTCAVADTAAYYDEYAETYTIKIGGYSGKGNLRTNMVYTLNLSGEQIPCEFYLEDAPRGTRIEGNKLITGSVGGTIVICGKGDGFNVEPRTLNVEEISIPYNYDKKSGSSATDVIPKQNSTKYNYDDTPNKSRVRGEGSEDVRW